MTNDGPGYVFRLNAIVSQRTLPSNETTTQTLDDNLELLGMTYENVYGTNLNGSYQFFLHQRTRIDWI
ncbi:MAG: hypothetical protein ACI9LN_002054 [Saprospiraceae bacterium]|jgi:hypothetical protein